MVNRTGQGKTLPEIDTRVGVSSLTPGVNYSTVSGAAKNAGEPFELLARNFSAISGRMEDRLDKIAADSAAREGLAAGAARDTALRRDSTISGDAFDEAAMRSMIARHDTQARVTAEEIYSQHKDDPAALQKKLADYKNGILSGGLPEEIKIKIGNSFDRMSAAYMGDAQKRLETRVIDQDRAAAMADFEERQKAIEKLARLSGTDASAAVSMSMEIEDLKKAALAHGPKGSFVFDGVEYPADPARSGALNLTQIQKLVLDTADNARESRIIGKFMGANGLAAKQQFLDAFSQEFSDGKNDFSIEQYDRLSSRMRGDISRLQAQSSGQFRQLEKGIGNAVSMIEKGYNPGAETVRAMETQAALSGENTAIAAAREMRALYDFQNEARALRPDQLQSWVNSETARVNEKDAPGPVEISRLELAGKLLNTMKTELVRDPLSWANRAGMISIEPVNIADPASLQKRLADAAIVESHYGVPLQLLTDEEVTQFKTAYDAADADGRAGMITAISQGFGVDAVHAFGDISKTDTALANIGALASLGPSHETALRDFSAGDAALADGAKAIPEGSLVSAKQASVMGNAYGFSPGAGKAVTETADRIYTARALRKGLNPASFDENLYGRALQEASGAWFDRGGTQHGGIVTQKGGHKIVLPPDMTELQFNDLIDNLDENALIAASVGGGGALFENGNHLSPEDFRRGYLISSGPGRYLFSTTNPKKGEPTFLYGTNPDGLYEIDLTKIPGGQP